MRHEHIITVNPELCIRCGLCRKDCPLSADRLMGKLVLALSIKSFQRDRVEPLKSVANRSW